MVREIGPCQRPVRGRIALKWKMLLRSKGEQLVQGAAYGGGEGVIPGVPHTNPLFLSSEPHKEDTHDPSVTVFQAGSLEQCLGVLTLSSPVLEPQGDLSPRAPLGRATRGSSLAQTSPSPQAQPDKSMVGPLHSSI